MATKKKTVPVENPFTVVTNNIDPKFDNFGEDYPTFAETVQAATVPLNYYGGKGHVYAQNQYAINFLCQHADNNSLAGFVDVFGGSGSVVLNTMAQSFGFNQYIYNDIVKGLSDFFTILKDEEYTKQLVDAIPVWPTGEMPNGKFMYNKGVYFAACAYREHCPFDSSTFYRYFKLICYPDKGRKPKVVKEALDAISSKNGSFSKAEREKRIKAFQEYLEQNVYDCLKFCEFFCYLNRRLFKEEDYINYIQRWTTNYFSPFTISEYLYGFCMSFIESYSFYKQEKYKEENYTSYIEAWEKSFTKKRAQTQLRKGYSQCAETDRWFKTFTKKFFKDCNSNVNVTSPEYKDDILKWLKKYQKQYDNQLPASPYLNELQERDIWVSPMICNAVCEYIVVMGSFNNTRQSYNESSCSHFKENYISSIIKAGNELRETMSNGQFIVCNMDTFDFLHLHDLSNHIKFYDPPYVHSSRSENATDTYDSEMTDADHNKLIKILMQQTNWILCGKVSDSEYDSKPYAELDMLPGVLHVTYTTINSSSNKHKTSASGKSKKQDSIEHLWIRIDPASCNL